MIILYTKRNYYTCVVTHSLVTFGKLVIIYLTIIIIIIIGYFVFEFYFCNTRKSTLRRYNNM